MDAIGRDTVIVIPARLNSSRLPRKLLLSETGQPLIQHTYEAACSTSLAAEVIVATDHDDIASVVRRFGGSAQMTDPNAASGTDRVAEVASDLPMAKVIVNVQGDEPELSGASIDLSVQLLDTSPDAVMSTLAAPIRTREQLEDPACVKVVCDDQGRALYFSRSPIPFVRDWDDAYLTAAEPLFFQHIGLYAYRRDFLLQLAKLAPSPLEKLEKLEQLRVLNAGFKIVVGVVDEPSIGIDTPADYRAFVRRHGQRTMAKKVA